MDEMNGKDGMDETNGMNGKDRLRETGKNNLQGTGMEEEGIDFAEIIGRLWKGRRLVLISTGVALVLGVFIAMFSPKSYSSKCTIIPHTSSSNMQSMRGSLSAIASMAGISMAQTTQSNGSPVYPTVYPQLMENADLVKDLIYSKVYFKEAGKPISIYEFYTTPEYHKFNIVVFLKQYTVGLPGMLMTKLFSTHEKVRMEEQSKDSVDSEGRPTRRMPVRYLNQQEMAIANSIMRHISIDLSNKEGYVTIRASFSDPVAAAQICALAAELLQKYIIYFKKEKALDTYNYVCERYEEARREFEQKQGLFAEFVDGNRIMSTAAAKARGEGLHTDFEIAYSVYSQLSQKKMEAELMVKEETQNLSVIEPAVIPLKPSSPNRPKIIFIWMFMGAVLSCCYVYFLPELKRVLKKACMEVKAGR